MLEGSVSVWSVDVASLGKWLRNSVHARASLWDRLVLMRG